MQRFIKLLKKLGINKSLGSDKVSTEMINDLKDKGIVILCDICKKKRHMESRLNGIYIYFLYKSTIYRIIVLISYTTKHYFISYFFTRLYSWENTKK